ncbi:MAG: ferrochelatase [Planctomycetes bacterium]|nr:ferrochelatase [Planctomycetota bacterium]
MPVRAGVTAPDGVLLLAYGGPSVPEEVRPFLREILGGRTSAEGLVEAVERQYDCIGGVSPLRKKTEAQAAALADALAASGMRLPVAVGMRHGPPSIGDALDDLARRGCRHARGIILSPFRSPASWDAYRQQTEVARAALGARSPQVSYAGPWGEAPAYVEAVAGRIREELARSEPGGPVHIVFTAHAIPYEMAHVSPYSREFSAASGAVAVRVPAARVPAARVPAMAYSMAYQSRPLRAAGAWTGPDLRAHLAALALDGVRDVVVCPIGFVCDHKEVLYDLDVEARTLAESAGMRYRRASTVEDHPGFIGMLADLVRPPSPC